MVPNNYKFALFVIVISSILVLISTTSRFTWSSPPAPGCPEPGGPIKIGVILPLSGPLAPIGLSLKKGADLAAEIVNDRHPDPKISIAQWRGIPRLRGAKIRLIYADSRGKTEWGAHEAKRLIEKEKVIGLLGCYQSSVTHAASEVAERKGVPFVNADSTSPALSKRGFKWFWRVTPHETWFTADLFDFLDGLVAGKARGVKQVRKKKIQSLSVAAVNTDWGVAALREIEKFATERGYKIVKAIRYSPKATDLTTQASRMKASKASCYLFAPYVPDAILFIKALKDMRAAPFLIWGGAGFVAPEFSKTLGADVNGILTRNLFSPELGKVIPVAAELNRLYKKMTGYDFSGSSAREFVGVQVWTHALNNATCTDPEAIRKALNELYIPPEELIMPWKGVRFGSPFPGDTQQNELGSGIINQYRGFPVGKLEVVFPFRFGTADLIFPFPGWK